MIVGFLQRRSRVSKLDTVKRFGAVGNGLADDTLAFLDAAATKKPLLIPAGAYRLSAPVAFHSLVTCDPGVTLHLYGPLAANYSGGAVVLRSGATWVGGELYTLGEMGGENGRVVVVEQGSLVGARIWSQLNGNVLVVNGSVEDCELIGAHNRIIHAVPGHGHSITLRRNRLSHCGVRFADRQWASVDQTNTFAMRIQPTSATAGPIRIEDNVITYATKQGIWVQPSSALQHPHTLILRNTVDRCGYYLDANGDSQFAHLSGTAIEVVSCPDAVIRDNVCRNALGYLMAVAGGSHRAIVQANTLTHAADPAIAVVSSDDVVVTGNYVAGSTYGVTAGEDDLEANNTLVTQNTFVGLTHAAWHQFSGTGLTALNNSTPGVEDAP